MRPVFPPSPSVAHPWRTSLAWTAVGLYATIGFVIAVAWLLDLVGPLHGWSFVPVTV